MCSYFSKVKQPAEQQYTDSDDDTDAQSDEEYFFLGPVLQNEGNDNQSTSDSSDDEDDTEVLQTVQPPVPVQRYV